MAEIVLTNALVYVGTSAAPDDISDHVRNVSINYTAELMDRTAMGSTFHKRIAGLKDATVTVELNNDFADDDVDEILWNLVGSTANRVLVKPVNANASANNPRYLGSMILEGYSPLGQGVGELVTTSVTFQANGQFQRAISS